jgi:hypothetical protein
MEDVEEVVMPSSMNPRRNSRADVTKGDIEMPEAPPFLSDSFPAMPTPASFADYSNNEANLDIQPHISRPCE